MTTIYLECVEGKSNKFYEITLNGAEVATRYGACGAAGVRGSKSFDSAGEAKKFFDKTVAEKKKKGYKEVTHSEETVAEKPAAAEKSTGKKNSKKRGFEEGESNPKAKVQKSVSFIASQVEVLSAQLQEKLNAQKEEAKEKEWTYDPRPTIDVTHVTLAHLLQHLNVYNAATIDSIATNLKKAAKEDSDGAAAKLLEQIVEELGNEELFNESQIQALAAHRFLEGTLVRNLLEEGDESFENAKNAKDLSNALKSNLSINKILEKFPIPHATKLDESELLPTELEDGEDEGDWWDSFCSHMLVLFNHFDQHNCRSMGRIIAAFKNIPHLGKTGEEIYENHRSTIESGDEEDDEAVKEFLTHIKKKYSIGKGLTKLSKPQLYVLAVRELWKEPLDCRTLFGHVLCYNVRETDYSGTRSGIIGYAGENLMRDDYGQVLECLHFIRDCLILGKTDDVEVITSACYVPGMKDPYSMDVEEEEGEGGGANDEEEA